MKWSWPSPTPLQLSGSLRGGILGGCVIFSRSPLFFLPPFSSPQCNNDYAPVCGSNNQNYQNECFLRRDACKQQSEVLIMSEGACPAGTYIYITAPTLAHSWMRAHAHSQERRYPRGIYICTERILKKVTRIEHFLHISLQAHGWFRGNAKPGWRKCKYCIHSGTVVSIKKFELSIHANASIVHKGFSNHGVMNYFKGDTRRKKKGARGDSLM